MCYLLSTMSLQSKQIEVFDPFSNFDPDAKPFDPAVKQFNPNVDPFDPSKSTTTKTDLSSWKVVAAEYSGKAVAVLLSPDSVLHVCTSPSFNSKCSHKGLSCLDWETVDMGKGRSATPEPTFKSLHDSGVENFTDNSSEEIEKINRVAKWSAEASRHADEWSADVTGHNGNHEWPEGVTGWSEDACGQVVQAVEWSPTVPNVWTEEYPTPEYHITVEYHTTDDTGYHHGLYQSEDDYHLPEETYPTRPCYGNDPVVVFQPWESQVMHSGDSWSEGLGINISGLSLDQGSLHKQEKVDAVDKEKIREEFKRKILSNVSSGADSELDEEAKIREDFKNKILSNLTVTEDETSEDKIKEAFRKQVLANLRDVASDTVTIDNDTTCDEIRARETFKKQILSNLEKPI